MAARGIGFGLHSGAGSGEPKFGITSDSASRSAEACADRRLRIFLVDRASLTRECLSRLLELDGSGLRVEGVADLDDLACGEASTADAVVIDIKALPVDDPDVQAKLAALGERMPNTPILVISERSQPADALQAVQSGARGYFPVTLTARMLIAAIRLVAAGGIFLPPSMLQIVATASPDDWIRKPHTAMQ